VQLTALAPSMMTSPKSTGSRRLAKATPLEYERPTRNPRTGTSLDGWRFTTLVLLFIVSRHDNSLLQSVWRAQFCRGTVLQSLGRVPESGFRRAESVGHGSLHAHRGGGGVVRTGQRDGGGVRRVLDSSDRLPGGCDHRASSDLAGERDLRFGRA